jgi:hypothetical protein
MAQTLIYPSVSAEQWGKIKTALALNSIELVGTTGLIDSHGVQAQYQYAALSLTVTVLHAPWIIGIAHVASMLDDKIKAELA